MSDSEIEDYYNEGSESDAEDERFKTQLQNCLDEVQHDGTFFSHQVITSHHNPGLSIKNYGTIGLPLSTRDAHGIASICKQSPFGKGSETIIDTSVRKTWELDAADFECLNPRWAAFTDSIVKRAVTDLGVQVPVVAQRYKLLLYEEGAFFKAHRDTEKVPGMFGTLVICLPSAHTGGEVHLVHGSEKHVLETAQASAFDVTTLAWYSDVQHEVKPVTSGYRLVLTYNLSQSQNERIQSAAALDQSHAKLERLLRNWNKSQFYSRAYIYPLNYQYTEANLRMQALKGEDAAKAKYLQQLCDKNGFFWFLGTMTKQTVDEDYGEEEDSISWDCIVTPAGGKVELNMLIEPEMILGEDLYEGRSADSEDEGEFTGNEGMASTYRYHNTVCILMRKPDIINFFPSSGGADRIRGLFHLLRDDFLSNLENSPSARSEAPMLRILTCLLREASEKRSTAYYGSYHSGFDESRVQSLQLFVDVSEFCNEYGLTDVVRQALGTVLTMEVIPSSSQIVQIIARQFERDSGENAEGNWDKFLPPQGPNRPTFEDVERFHKNLLLLKAALPQTIVQMFEGWTQQKLGAMILNVAHIEEKHFSTFISLLPLQANRCRLLPAIVNQGSRGYLIRFLSRLATAEIDKTSSWDTLVKTSYQTAIPSALPKLAIALDDLNELQSHPRPYHPIPDEYTASGPRPTYVIDFLAVLYRTLEFGMEKEAQSLVQSGFPELSVVDGSLWRFWEAAVNLVEKLINILSKHDIRTVNETAAPWIKSTLLRLTLVLANRKPIQPPNWARATSIPCDCEPCRWLKHFLADPNQEAGRFTYVANIRTHLQRHLPSQDYKFEVDKRGSPQTLVIWKTNNAYNRLKQDWDRDRESYWGRVRRLRSSFTDAMLGEDITTYTSMGNASPTPPVLQPTPPVLQPSPMSQPSDGHSYSTTNSHSRMNQHPNIPPQRSHQQPAIYQQPAVCWKPDGISQDAAFQQPMFSWNARSLEPIPAAMMNAREVPPVAGVKRKADVVDLTEDMSD
ncbi:hypothetical protein P154DRAFT_535176 [Amniculicola lignicola CBS 123094]|uniref:Prolyl 4-hydroxylase alpha subunit Fe(2+) 2OG dioxygenase domain-containing protein n=1 Tax=Amniculicola lignicola CBS 123094 TaxID=1392246 RepID=A0A6A5WLI6_9PLEO|nr:hypothetical protein P154DRAFT_535176 [Amniculicola lignicola CBS 123094]